MSETLDRLEALGNPTFYYCPICERGNGDRSWHPVGRAGLIPQTQDEHTCVRVPLPALVAVARAAQVLYEQVEMAESVGTCLPTRAESMLLGDALAALDAA